MAASNSGVLRAVASQLLQSCRQSLGQQFSNAAKATSVQVQQFSHQANLPTSERISWVFLGPPGVGKGTYASRAAKHFGVAHIATGDLIREEIKAKSEIGRQMQDIVAHGKLVPDEMIFKLLERRLEHGKEQGEKGFILDGFPRTKAQAHTLLQHLPLQLGLNLSLREEVLVTKCLGRRLCGKCGKNYNIADIYLPGDGSRPEIRMPPLNPPPDCTIYMEMREDDTEEVIRRRLKVYKDQSKPVEDVLAEAGILREFEIVSGIPETLPGLLDFLSGHVPKGMQQPSVSQSATTSQARAATA